MDCFVALLLAMTADGGKIKETPAKYGFLHLIHVLS
jgi:hypothetical protein